MRERERLEKELDRNVNDLEEIIRSGIRWTIVIAAYLALYIIIEAARSR